MDTNTTPQDEWADAVAAAPVRTALYVGNVSFRTDADLDARIHAFTDTFPNTTAAMRALLNHPDVKAVMARRIESVTTTAVGS